MNSFVLIGTIMSFDPEFATVEFQLNPATNGGPAIAVMRVDTIPCDVEVGGKIYVVKHERQDLPVVSCEKENKDL
tara:strand:+ start:313 stop:537 length:225 start_codon:yes stop_codon:yes gene_type:complete